MLRYSRPGKYLLPFNFHLLSYTILAIRQQYSSAWQLLILQQPDLELNHLARRHQPDIQCISRFRPFSTECAQLMSWNRDFHWLWVKPCGCDGIRASQLHFHRRSTCVLWFGLLWQRKYKRRWLRMLIKVGVMLLVFLFILFDKIIS